MLNEPEYEDQESINNVTAVIGSVSTTRAREHTNVSTLDILVQNQMEHNTSRNPETQAFEPHIDEIVHSTPIRYSNINFIFTRVKFLLVFLVKSRPIPSAGTVRN